MARLVLTVDGLMLREIPLVKERTTIGRRPTSDIQIDNLIVSGDHAVVVTILSDSFLEDLGSTNGTFVNGQSVRKHFLQNNDVIELGKYSLRYVSDQAEGSEPPRPIEKTQLIAPGSMTLAGSVGSPVIVGSRPAYGGGDTPLAGMVDTGRNLVLRSDDPNIAHETPNQPAGVPVEARATLPAAAPREIQRTVPTTIPAMAASLAKPAAAPAPQSATHTGVPRLPEMPKVVPTTSIYRPGALPSVGGAPLIPVTQPIGVADMSVAPMALLPQAAPPRATQALATPGAGTGSAPAAGLNATPGFTQPVRPSADSVAPRGQTMPPPGLNPSPRGQTMPPPGLNPSPRGQAVPPPGLTTPSPVVNAAPPVLNTAAAGMSAPPSAPNVPPPAPNASHAAGLQAAPAPNMSPPHARAQPGAPLALRAAAVQILNGSNIGLELDLNKPLTTLGKPDVQVAVITRRPQGYFLMHVEGDRPLLNGQPLAEHVHLLNDHDLVDLAGIKVEFYFKD